MKHVVIVRPKVGFGLGGAETHAGMIALKLLERGYKVSVLAQEISFPKEVLGEINFLQVKKRGRGSLLKYLFFLKEANRVLESLKKDYLLLSPFRFPKADLLILCDPLFKFWLKQRPLPKIIKEISNLGIRARVFLKYEELCLRSAKRIIALFSPTVELLKNLYPEVVHKVAVCHRGIDHKRFNPELKKQKHALREKYRFNPKDFIILFVGNEPRRKGLSLLLEVFPKLPENVKLLIAGIQGKSQERIVYLGKVQNIEEFYALSDLVVLPTLYDPGALTTLEALASGTPIITSVFDGVKEFIKEGVNGWITTLEKEDLLQKMHLAMKTKISEEACSQSISHLTWDSYVDCLVSQMERL